MPRTTATLDQEHAHSHTAPEPQTIELNILTALGTLHLAPPPASRTPAEYGLGAALPQRVTAPPVAPAPRRQHGDISARCYDLAVAALILSSAAVALSRLIWMGQP